MLTIIICVQISIGIWALYVWIQGLIREDHTLENDENFQEAVKVIYNDTKSIYLVPSRRAQRKAWQKSRRKH